MQDPIKNAINRRLSPLQKTASVAGFKSTKELGAKLTDEELDEELVTRQLEKYLGQE